MTKYFSPEMNRVYLMNSLHQVKQLPGESIDNFHMRVREKMAHLDVEKLTINQVIELVTMAQLVNNCANMSPVKML